MLKTHDVQQGVDPARQRWPELAEALSQPSAALNEEQRQNRNTLVEYFSILQDWAGETFTMGEPVVER